MIYVVKNCTVGETAYIRAKTSYYALSLFLKSISKKATIIAHENFYYAVDDNGTVYSVIRGR